ncbi:hypothetical protein RclHR1_01250020 [Rhizophagus clarus]|uniref:F-box domain-containing protein n=1 Tax=Rhizophagus clarus TaxID=94130 RepID=A0A2Z6Q7A5_9GLOM|nr:hypothetical protein RclHR1_01250020 [Rhizophagus clarus]GES79248.1 hypothetical protein GLOIN_2v1875654 [Rhizophagus clarus]
MTCSKIFSGDLPELTNEIIQYFKKDFSTLYSCILVNRLWCRLTIPLLWENPFSIPTRNHRYIEIYLCHLNENGKAKFNEYKVNNNLIPSNTLFNYPSFIKNLNIRSICFSIKRWIPTFADNNHKKLKKLVYWSLFEVFIENRGILNSFEIEMSTINHFENFDDTIKLILQNPNFIHNIENLTFHIYFSFPNIKNIILFLEFLSSNCNSISSISFEFPIINIDNFLLIEKCLCQIIISQSNLQKISFGSESISYSPSLSLKSLKNSNCSNSLNVIIFYYIDFKNIITILQEVFDHLNVLESIHLLYCDSLNSDFVHQIIKINKPFRLKSLFINEILNIESLQLLLQKFGNSLENFEFGTMDEEYEESRRQLLRLILKYCTKIKYLLSDKPNDINIYQLIKNIGQTINYLDIDLEFDDYEELSPIVLKNLGQVLPPKLEYLCLSLSFNTNDLEIFLKNSQNTFVNRLLIRNILKNKGESVLFYIKEYIMKKEKVKYLAILETFLYCLGEKELFYLKDEVNEFKLHNIIVQKFFDSCITINDIISIE